MINTDLPAPMGERFGVLMEQLQELTKGATVYYHPNHGNWGDGLIMAGTRRFLADAGIDFTECQYKRIRSPQVLRKPDWLRNVDRKTSVLIYGGGGGLCKLWDISKYIGFVGNHFLHTIILPSTFEVKPRLRSATFYCRDRYVSADLSGGEFVDDMAFYLGRRRAGVAGRGRGYFFRTDAESAGEIELPEANRDVSSEHDYQYPVEKFFDALSEFEVIHTDRLHVAIASCLLGKEVKLYPGRYFKNEALFHSSMQGLFPLASFMQGGPSPLP